MSGELILDGKKYISSKHLARSTKYTHDYISRLCREGKIKGELVGRSWFVDPDSLEGHRKNIKKENSSKFSDDSEVTNVLISEPKKITEEDEEGKKEKNRTASIGVWGTTEATDEINEQSNEIASKNISSSRFQESSFANTTKEKLNREEINFKSQPGDMENTLADKWENLLLNEDNARDIDTENDNQPSNTYYTERASEHQAIPIFITPQESSSKRNNLFLEKLAKKERTYIEFAKKDKATLSKNTLRALSYVVAGLVIIFSISTFINTEKRAIHAEKSNNLRGQVVHFMDTILSERIVVELK